MLKARQKYCSAEEKSAQPPLLSELFITPDGFVSVTELRFFVPIHTPLLSGPKLQKEACKEGQKKSQQQTGPSSKLGGSRLRAPPGSKTMGTIG